MVCRLTICLIASLLFGGRASAQTSREDDVAELIKKFSAKDQATSQRVDAILALRGPKARLAIPELINALADGDEIADYVGLALLRIGPDALPALEKALDSNNEKTRYWATRHLSFPEWETKVVVPILIKALGHKDKWVRREAARGLRGGEDKRAILPLLELARNDSDDYICTEAILALARFDSAAVPAMPFLIEVITTCDSPQKVEAAVIALSSIGGKAVSPLVSVMADAKQPIVARSRAALALGRMTPEQRDDMKDAIPVLIGLLQDQDRSIRIRAASLLGSLAKRAAAGLPALNAMLQKGSRMEQVIAANAIYLIGGNAEPVLPVLVIALKSNVASVRASALWVMGDMKGDAWPAMPHLVDACRDPDAEVRRNAVRALNAIGQLPENAMRALRDRLNDNDSWVRMAAQNALRDQSANPKPRSP